jgi:ABC-type multidrug transport system fused ATPase/permease subunit
MVSPLEIALISTIPRTFEALTKYETPYFTLYFYYSILLLATNPYHLATPLNCTISSILTYNIVSSNKENQMEKLMEINHVGYSYHTMQGETPALSNINFTVHKGDFLAIVGPSGCGNAMVLLWKQIILLSAQTLQQPPIFFRPRSINGCHR